MVAANPVYGQIRTVMGAVFFKRKLLQNYGKEFLSHPCFTKDCYPARCKKVAGKTMGMLLPLVPSMNYVTF
jgi:hypothetical protein